MTYEWNMENNQIPLQMNRVTIWEIVVVAGFGVRTERDAVLLVLPGEGDWEFS
jgi:hypothetical protein